MTDNVQLNRGRNGDIVAADDIGGVKHQRVKIEFGTDGNATEVSEDNRLPTTSANGPLNLPFWRLLDTVGDGSGSKGANGNHATGTVFRLAPGTGEIMRVASLTIIIEDTTTGSNATTYGALPTLTSGVVVRTHDGSSTIVDFTDGVPLKTNAGLSRLSYESVQRAWGTNTVFAARIMFTSTGQHVRLDGDAGEELQVICRDNLTGLIAHYFRAVGYTESTPT